MRRIERVQTRRRLAMQATLSAFVVMSVAFGATRVINATPTGGTNVLVQEETQKPEPKTESPKPKPKPEAKKAKPKPTEAPKAEPTYVAPKPEPTYVKPKPTYSKEPVPGLSVELFPYTDAYAGKPMDWKVKAYDTAGRLLRVELLYGDGTKSVIEPSEPCVSDGLYAKKFFSHTYAKAGYYTAKATVTTGGCGAATETKVVSASVKVNAEGTGNGPAQPTVSAEQQPGVATLNLHGADADGWVKKFYIDWGDGSESYAGPRPWDGCQNGKPSEWDTTASHSYAGPGTYTVTVTVLSTDCSAGQGQTKSVTLTITI